MSERLVKKVLSEKSFSLLLVQGTDRDNNNFASYLLIKDSRIEKFKKDYAQKPVCLDDYGEVVFGIFADEVDKETEQKVIQLFKAEYLNN